MSDAGIDMGTVPELIVAIVTLLTPVGVAFRFVWNKIEARFEKIERELEKCERGRAVKLTVIELLWQAVLRADPESPVLARAKILLDGLKAGEARDGD